MVCKTVMYEGDLVEAIADVAAQEGRTFSGQTRQFIREALSARGHASASAPAVRQRSSVRGASSLRRKPQGAKGNSSETGAAKA